MRFDDSLKTVLAADTSTSLGARAAFRQLTDLIARRRVSPDAVLIARLRALRAEVSPEVRAAAARGLALADPPPELVDLFVDDRPEVAGAVLRAVRLPPEAWDPLIGAAGPFGRSVLRRRADLPPSAVDTLARFAATDLALPAAREESLASVPLDQASREASEASRGRPGEADAPIGMASAVAAPTARSRPQELAGERFEIADLVHRIEEFQRDRGGAAPIAPVPVRAFRFETDADGVICWTDTAPRGAVIGLGLRDGPGAATPVVDGAAAGAFRKRAQIGNARLRIGGSSAVTGEWRIAATPLFDPASGRFLGYRGQARRPHIDETAVSPRSRGNTAQVEGLRRLVHELRTPTNAIAGFSELIEAELIGPVPAPYRARAGVIRQQVSGLIAAIDDLELAARLDGNALELRRERLDLASVVGEVLGDLVSLIRRRGSGVTVQPGAAAVAEVDERAGTRLVSRLLSTLVAVSEQGETLTVTLDRIGEGKVSLAITRPRVLRDIDEATLLTLDGAPGVARVDGSAEDDAPLLGLGFALRLLRNLAAELGGGLSVLPDRLTVALPAALNDDMDRMRSSTT